MKTRIVLMSIACVAGAIGYLLRPVQQETVLVGGEPTVTPSQSSAAPSIAATIQSPPAVSIFTPDPTPSAPDEEDYLGETFNVDSAGNLLLDRRARITLEQLYALYTTAEQAQKLDEFRQTLPATAYARVTDLLERYTEFSVAAKQNFPPGVAPANEDDALIQLDGLSALRTAHFGADDAKALFGEEEKLNRQLLTLMRLEKDASLTIEEKAERAQALLTTTPDIAAIEKRNRMNAPNRPPSQPL